MLRGRELVQCICVLVLRLHLGIHLALSTCQVFLRFLRASLTSVMFKTVTHCGVILELMKAMNMTSLMFDGIWSRVEKIGLSAALWNNLIWFCRSRHILIYSVSPSDSCKSNAWTHRKIYLRQADVRFAVEYRLLMW